VKLYFLRHGAAVDAEAWDGDDASRPLTSDGRKSMEREAKAMDELDLQLDLESRLIEDRRLSEAVDANVVAEMLRVAHGRRENRSQERRSGAQRPRRIHPPRAAN
jgi:broad specificity phosphatase PhoE